MTTSTPAITRAAPAYVQIHDHYAQQIKDGQLLPHMRLPSQRDIAREFGVSVETAGRAVSMLKDSGLVATDHQATWVAVDFNLERTPAERLTRARDGLNGETIEVVATGIVTAPAYVAAIFGFRDGEQILRREEIASRDGRPRLLTVDWVPGWSKTLAEDILSPQPIDGGPLGAVERHTLRPVRLGRDALRARGADDREARSLGLATGTPIMAGVHRMMDVDGQLLLYGEWCQPPDTVLVYSYELPEPSPDGAPLGAS